MPDCLARMTLPDGDRPLPTVQTALDNGCHVDALFRERKRKSDESPTMPMTCWLIAQWRGSRSLDDFLRVFGNWL